MNHHRGGYDGQTGFPAVCRIALVQACWHCDIVDAARDAFLNEASVLGLPGEQVDLFDVPGAFELPLQAKLLASSGLFHAIVAIGLVVDCGIYRHEFVASAVIDGLMQVQLETLVPVLSAVLTPIRFHDSGEHRAFFNEHFKIKGAEAAHACLGAIQATERARCLATAMEQASCRPVLPKVAISDRSET